MAICFLFSSKQFMLLSLKIQLLVILCNIWIMNIEINIFTVLKKDLKNMSWGTAHLSTSKFKSIKVDSLPIDTAEIETGMTAKSSPGTRQTDAKNLVWFWRSRKKFSQISNTFLYLPFFLLIILCPNPTKIDSPYTSLASLAYKDRCNIYCADSDPDPEHCCLGDKVNSGIGFSHRHATLQIWVA